MNNALKELVLHAEIDIGGTMVHFSDTQDTAIPGNMISLAIQSGTAQEVIYAFEKFSWMVGHNFSVQCMAG